MNRPIEVGDRVRIYSLSSTNAKGEVTEVSGDALKILLDNGGYRLVHTKACRRLKPPPLKRIWVPKRWSSDFVKCVQTYGNGWLEQAPYPLYINNFVEFVEVKK